MAVTSKCLLCLHTLSLLNFFNGQLFNIRCFFSFQILDYIQIHLMHKIEPAIRLYCKEGSEGKNAFREVVRINYLS